MFLDFFFWLLRGRKIQWKNRKKNLFSTLNNNFWKLLRNQIVAKVLRNVYWQICRHCTDSAAQDAACKFLQRENYERNLCRIACELKEFIDPHRKVSSTFRWLDFSRPRLLYLSDDILLLHWFMWLSPNYEISMKYIKTVFKVNFSLSSTVSQKAVKKKKIN